MTSISLLRRRLSRPSGGMSPTNCPSCVLRQRWPARSPEVPRRLLVRHGKVVPGGMDAITGAEPKQCSVRAQITAGRTVAAEASRGRLRHRRGAVPLLPPCSLTALLPPPLPRSLPHRSAALRLRQPWPCRCLRDAGPAPVLVNVIPRASRKVHPVLLAAMRSISLRGRNLWCSQTE